MNDGPAEVTKRIRRPLTFLAVVGIAFLSFNIGLAILGPIFAPHSVSALVSETPYAAPGHGSILGSDYMGRDLLSRLLDGAKYSLGVPLAATVLGFMVGMAVGFTAAEIRGQVDTAITWLIDVLLSFPPILLALLVIAGVGSSLFVLIGTIAFIQTPRVARVARSVAIGIAALDFVDVARARGESLISILVREIYPNSLRPLAVEFGLRLSYAVLFLSSLSFLGLGIQPPNSDWGSLVRENLGGVYYGAPAAIFPAALISLLVVGVNLTVDWLSASGDYRISEELR